MKFEMKVALNNDLNHLLVLVCSVFGVIAFFSPLAGAANLSHALALALDFWTAGGLIRLTGVPSWSAIEIVAALIVLRKITRFSIHYSIKTQARLLE